MQRGRKTKFNAGAWRVQQERAQIDIDSPPPLPPFVVGTLGQAIPELMKELGTADLYLRDEIVREWAGMLGPALAKNTRPGPVERGSLTVFVTNSMWLSELKRYSAKLLMQKLQNKFGADRIRSLRIQLDPEAGRRG